MRVITTAIFEVLRLQKNEEPMDVLSRQLFDCVIFLMDVSAHPLYEKVLSWWIISGCLLRIFNYFLFSLSPSPFTILSRFNLTGNKIVPEVNVTMSPGGTSPQNINSRFCVL